MEKATSFMQSNKTTTESEQAIEQFLTLLENDIQAGRSLDSLPEELQQSMLATLGQVVDMNAPIEGDVVL